MSVIADSSTTTMSPACSRHASSPSTGRGLPAPGPAASRSWVASQRATLRAVSPSAASTSVAICEVASPNTRRSPPGAAPGVLLPGGAAGSQAAGSWPAGSWPAGSWPAGSWPAGSWAAGSWAAGSWVGSVQARAIAPTTNDFPVPAGPIRHSTRAPEVSTPRTAAAWSTPSSIPDSRSCCTNRSAATLGSAAPPRPAVPASITRSVWTCSGVAYSRAPGASYTERPLPSRSPSGSRSSPGRGASSPATDFSSSSLSVSSNLPIAAPSVMPIVSGNARLSAATASLSVHPDLAARRSSNASSITGRGNHVSAATVSPRASSTVRATPARPPSTSARIFASTRSSISSRLSPVCDFARRVNNVACWASRSSSNPFGPRPWRASNAETSSEVFAVTCRRRVEINSIACWAMPTTSRAFPSSRVTSSTPNAAVSRSSSVRSPTAAAACWNLYNARESAVRHTPSAP